MNREEAIAFLDAQADNPAYRKPDPAAKAEQDRQWRLEREAQELRSRKAHWAAFLIGSSTPDNAEDRQLEADRIFLEYGMPKEGWLKRKIAEHRGVSARTRAHAKILAQEGDTPAAAFRRQCGAYFLAHKTGSTFEAVAAEIIADPAWVNFPLNIAGAK